MMYNVVIRNVLVIYPRVDVSYNLSVNCDV